MNNFENTNGFKIIQNWMMEKSISPFKFQVQTWQKFGSGYSGMVVAPTGFGKSFAVLVPSIIEALENGKRIVISTETLTLQDQYLEKDLPLLVEALKPLGINLKFAAAKGRNMRT